MRLRPRLLLGALGLVAAVGCNAKEEKKKKAAPAAAAQETQTPAAPVDAATIEKSLVEKGFFLGAGKHEWKEDEEKRKKHGWHQHPTVMEITLLSGEDDTPVVGAHVSVALTKWHDHDFPGGKGGEDGKDEPMPCGGDDGAPEGGKAGMELCLKSPVQDDQDQGKGKDGKDHGGGKGGGWHGGFDKGRRVSVHAGSSNVVTLIIRAGRNYEVAAKKEGFDVTYRTLHFDDRRGKFLAFPLKLWRWDGGADGSGSGTGGMDGKDGPAKDAGAKDDDDDDHDHGKPGPDDEVVDADEEKPEPTKPSDPMDGAAKPETVTRLKGCDEKDSFNPMLVLDMISKVAPKKSEELQKWLNDKHTLLDCSFDGDLVLILKDKEGSPVPFIINKQDAKFDDYTYEEALAEQPPKPSEPVKPDTPDGPKPPKPAKKPPHPFPMPHHDLELLHCDVRFGYLDDLKAFETALVNNMPHWVAKKILKKKKAGAELVDCSTHGPGVRLVYVTGTGAKRARWVVHVLHAHGWLPHLWHQGRKKQKQDFFDE